MGKCYKMRRFGSWLRGAELHISGVAMTHMHLERVARSTRRAPAAFTLVELLVCIGILAVLLSLLVPAVTKARDHGKAVVCQSHLRQLWQGWVLFATDHEGRLPGTRNNVTPFDPQQWSWLSGLYRDDDNPAKAWQAYQMRPQAGTIFKYVNQDYRVYRCPALDPCPPSSWPGPGVGSNGRYDYAAFTTFAGCLLANVPTTATFQYPDGHTARVPTPVIVETDARWLNGDYWDEAHCNIKKLAHHHFGGSYYASPDGTVNWFDEPSDPSVNANSWFVIGKHGKPFCMGRYQIWSEFGWGDFEKLS